MNLPPPPPPEGRKPLDYGSNPSQQNELLIQLFKEMDSRNEERLNRPPPTWTSYSAVLGGVAGAFLIINGFAMDTKSSIHQIYQVLNVGLGVQIALLAAISQHTKRHEGWRLPEQPK